MRVEYKDDLGRLWAVWLEGNPRTVCLEPQEAFELPYTGWNMNRAMSALKVALERLEEKDNGE